MRISKRSRSRGGFTLIELMISAALIGVLAAIAIPNFRTFQARSRRSEGYSNLGSMARTLKTFYAERGKFPDMLTETGGTDASLPDPSLYGGLGGKKMPWDAPTKAFFSIVGWQAEGAVYYSYDVSAPEGGGCTCNSCFTATAHGDVDGDGGWSALMYSYPQRDAAQAVLGECQSGVGALWAPKYDEPTWHPLLDQY